MFFLFAEQSVEIGVATEIPSQQQDIHLSF